jgi:hypothetical protein
MNTIFLDIDGVLNSERSMVAAKVLRPLQGYVSYTERHYTELDPVAINLLRLLVQETNSEIVISSSWRKLYDTLDFFKSIFMQFGWHGAPVVGMTPIVDSGFRGQEIQQYIDSNDFFTGPHIIFDDDRDFFEHQPLIHVDERYGLSYEHFDKAKQMLGFKE